MSLGIGIGLRRHRGNSWASYWKQRSLFFLDGTIVTVGESKYFKDNSANARNFLITGYDFDSTWTKGFPYKSAATISAPAADAALIDADINNFLYAGDGTPNQIPVVSLFQNIDFENTIYCKHSAQVLDANGVETYEPRVSQIFMTAAALSVSDLAKANTYFGVPSESATALWVAKTGNDTTGDGTKALPYLTIGKFITVGAGKSAYVKSGAYEEVMSFNGKAETIIGIGLNTLSSSTSGTIQYAGSASSTTIKGFSGLATLANKILIQCANTALVFDKLKFIGGTNDIRHTTGVSPITFTNSLLTKIQERLTDTTFDDCFFNAAITQTTLFKATGCKVTINRSRIAENTSTGLLNVYAAGTEYLVFGCDFYGNAYGDATNAFAPRLSILYCKVRLKTKPLVSYINNTGSRIIAINNNNILSEGAQENIITLKGKGTCEANDNTITGLLRAFTVIMDGLDADSQNNFKNNNTSSNTFTVTVRDTKAIIEGNIFASITSTRIDATATIADLSNAVQITGNALLSPNTENAMMIIGTEDGAVSYNMLNGSVISQNKLLAPRYFGNDPGAQHGIFVYEQTITAKHNYINGGSIGFAIKSEGNSHASAYHNNILINTNSPLTVKGQLGTLIYGNTVVFKVATTSSIGLALMANEGFAGSYSKNTKFKNNIIVDFREDVDTYLFQIYKADDLDGAEIDYNIYYKANGLASTHFAVIDSVWKTFAEWQALGFDAHSIVLTDEQAEALFTDHVNGDYSLRAGSVAIGAGVALDAAYDDGLDASTDWGSDSELPNVVLKQQGAAWDIGAYVH